jgi:hypothetical protein
MPISSAVREFSRNAQSAQRELDFLLLPSDKTARYAIGAIAGALDRETSAIGKVSHPKTENTAMRRR